ncbi:MAG: hypothetical protein U1F61_21840 [Opitutaceae bacterium]
MSVPLPPSRWLTLVGVVGALCLLPAVSTGTDQSRTLDGGVRVAAASLARADVVAIQMSECAKPDRGALGSAPPFVQAGMAVDQLVVAVGDSTRLNLSSRCGQLKDLSVHGNRDPPH